MSDPFLQGIAAMMYTLLSGRCPVGDEPANPSSPEWQNWYCRKTGYEIVWQLAKLNSRVPGFEVLPSSASATTVTANATDTLTVRFRYAPTSTVWVVATSDHPEILVSNPTLMFFTPQNYSNAQTASIRGTLTANSETANVNFITVADNKVFNGLSDQWAYVESTDSLAPATHWSCILSNMHATAWSGLALYTESAPTGGIAKVTVTYPDTATNKFMRVRVEKK